MSGMLNGGQLDPMMIQQLMQQLSAGRSDPFQRPIPGQELLAQPSQPQMQPEGGDAGFAGSEVATDFGTTQPGLPNLPDSFGGFGFGQNAPKMTQPQGLREKIIEQLLSQMTSGGMNGFIG